MSSSSPSNSREDSYRSSPSPTPSPDGRLSRRSSRGSSSVDVDPSPHRSHSNGRIRHANDLALHSMKHFVISENRQGGAAIIQESLDLPRSNSTHSNASNWSHGTSRSESQNGDGINSRDNTPSSRKSENNGTESITAKLRREYIRNLTPTGASLRNTLDVRFSPHPRQGSRVSSSRFRLAP